MSQPEPLAIAERLLMLFGATSPRKKTKSLQLTKAQFNALAGRQKIEDSILTPIMRRLRKEKLHLIRIGDTFAVLDEGTIGQWGTPDPKLVKDIAKMKPGLSPAAAWPFPIKKAP